MGRMRGQSLPVEEMMKLFAILLFAVIIFVILALISGALGPMFETMCQEHPEWPWCQTSTTIIDYETAKRSTLALSCAVNSVAQGSEWQGSFSLDDHIVGCSVFYSDSAEGVRVECEENGYIVLENVEIPYDEEVQSPTLEEARTQAEQQCSKYGSGVETAYISFITGEPRKFECRRTDLDCTVKDFHLPQDVSDAETWLKAAGDPEFLVYWQQFPVGEDSAWAGAHPWLEDAVDLVFAWWGAGKVFKLGKTAAKKPITWTASKLGFKTTTEQLSEKMVAEGISETLAKELSSEIATAASASPSLLSRLGTIGVATTGAATEGSLLLGAYLNSKALKYAGYPNSVILKSPYDDPQQVELAPDSEASPVISEEREISFYLASPCKADLEVKASNMVCGKYSYDFGDGFIDCNEPEFDYPGSELKTCATNVSEIFQSGGEIPKAVEELKDDKDGLKFYWYDNGRLYVRDPVTGLVYEFSNDMLSSEVGEVANYMTRLKFTDSSEQERSFVVSVDTGKIQNDDFSLEFLEDYYYCTQRYEDYNPSCVIVADRESFTKINPECAYCDELEAKIDLNRWLVFKEEAEELEDESGEIQESTVKKLGLIHGEGDDDYYWTTFLDSNTESDDSGYGMADFMSMKAWSGDPTVIILKVPDYIADDVMMGDNDGDGEMDFITVNNCLANGQYISVEKDEEVSGYNFCQPEENWVKTATRWAPVAGASIGSVIGGVAGFFGLGVGTVPGVATGTVWGSRVGAGIYTAYLVYEKAYGSTDIWPGKEY